ncbi:hypothetical protein HPB47_004504 [Ixodes persulcatus]|uniref:Uncharacterized protein n=1 Tax=Ixodes persulcatus TaxID=34615 RepID=A0AC60PFQ4_IXOPE|nr:hypothetical protein HPB47_004504 [Ixodes persulcatus]
MADLACPSRPPLRDEHDEFPSLRIIPRALFQVAVLAVHRDDVTKRATRSPRPSRGRRIRTIPKNCLLEWRHGVRRCASVPERGLCGLRI